MSAAKAGGQTNKAMPAPKQQERRHTPRDIASSTQTPCDAQKTASTTGEPQGRHTNLEQRGRRNGRRDDWSSSRSKPAQQSVAPTAKIPTHRAAVHRPPGRRTAVRREPRTRQRAREQEQQRYGATEDGTSKQWRRQNERRNHRKQHRERKTRNKRRRRTGDEQ